MKKKILVSAFVLAVGLMSARANDLHRVPGQPASVTRNVLSTKLPKALRNDIKKDYKDYWIADLYEVKEKRHPSYFITLENADQVPAAPAVVH